MEHFAALLVICAGNSPGTGEFPSQRPVTQSFNVIFDQCLKKTDLTNETPVSWDTLELIMTSL